MAVNAGLATNETSALRYRPFHPSGGFFETAGDDGATGHLGGDAGSCLSPVVTPPPVLSARDFVRWCQLDKPRTFDALHRWDILYRSFGAEICARRRAAFRAFFGRPLAASSSVDLCLADRYTACVNFAGADGVPRHVCDILPVVIGSQLDLRLRSAFWRDPLASREDERKLGLVVQNKNFYHFTVTMATNPKVAHVYRKSSKMHKIDSRVYYYDRNFRGNMFSFKQAALLLPCPACAVAASPGSERRADDGSSTTSIGGNARRRPGAAHVPDDRVGPAASSSSACSGVRCVIVEELYLRNCFKQDYLLLRRFCSCVETDMGDDGDRFSASDSVGGPSSSSSSSSVDRHNHDRFAPVLESFVQQFHTAGNPLSRGRLGSTTSAAPGASVVHRGLAALLRSLGRCEDVHHLLNVTATRVNDASLSSDLFAFVRQWYPNGEQIVAGAREHGAAASTGSSPASAVASSVPASASPAFWKLYIRMTNDRDDGGDLLFCNANGSEWFDDWGVPSSRDRSVSPGDHRSVSPGHQRSVSPGDHRSESSGDSAGSVGGDTLPPLSSAFVGPYSSSAAAAAADQQDQQRAFSSPARGACSSVSRLFVDNFHEFKKISECCFATPPDADERLLREQLYVLFLYLRRVLSRNEDIDRLCNKCVFDGPYLYNKLLNQLREYICHRLSSQDLNSLVVDTLVTRYRQLANTANLYMLISSKTNIRVELANEMKRSLKLSVKREKMYRNEAPFGPGVAGPRLVSTTVSAAAAAASSSSSTAVPAATVGAPGGPPVLSSAHTGPVSCLAGASATEQLASPPSPALLPDDEDMGVDEANDKCDFVIRHTGSFRSRNFFTGLVASAVGAAADDSDCDDDRTSAAAPFKFYVSSCNVGDVNAKQMISYSSQNLLQNIAASHFTDIEYVAETVKRPNVTNQHNSIKCSLIPRGAIRFLSYFNMGSLSSAGRTLNICSRNTVSFFLQPKVAVVEFQRWLVAVYSLVSGTASGCCSSSQRRSCVRHGRENCRVCFSALIVNEVPYVSVFIDSFYTRLLFLLVKLEWPAAQFYQKTPNIISVSLLSGILLIPMILVRDDRALYPRINVQRYSGALADDVWLFCPTCQLYFPNHVYDRASNVCRVPAQTVLQAQTRLRWLLTASHAFDLTASTDAAFVALHRPNRDGGVRSCSRHVWFSSNDLEFYQSVFAASTVTEADPHSFFVSPQQPVVALSPPFVYEIACHGLFLNCKFLHATDVSKLMVSINASRRRLRTKTCTDGGFLETLIDQNSRMIINRWPSNRGRSRVAPSAPDVVRPVHETCDEPPPSSSSLPPSSASDVRPVHEIRELPLNNTFRCCFMFGDWRGRNCEDAYVFDASSRPFLDNAIQLKMNFYRNDKLPIAPHTLRFHFEPRVIPYHTGVVFVLGQLISYNKLSFGSTFVHVKQICITSDLWVNIFFYVNYASYIRPEETVFAPSGFGARLDEDSSSSHRRRTTWVARHGGHRLVVDDEPEEEREEEDEDDDEEQEEYAVYDERARWPRVHVGGGGGASSNGASGGSSGASGGLCSVLFEDRRVSLNGNVDIHCQMTNKQFRFVIRLRNVRTVQKWQNSCGNKGVSACVDLSDLYTSEGGRVHVIVSAYSMIGRQLVAQLLEQLSAAGSDPAYRPERSLLKVYSRSGGGQFVGWAGYGDFFYSCDSPHDTIIASSPNFGNNATRMCNMTYVAGIGNGLSTWMANRSANHVNYHNNPINGIPFNVKLCLSVYHYYNRQLYQRRQLLREYRKKRRDHDRLAVHGVSSVLPCSIQRNLSRVLDRAATVARDGVRSGRVERVVRAGAGCLPRAGRATRYVNGPSRQSGSARAATGSRARAVGPCAGAVGPRARATTRPVLCGSNDDNAEREGTDDDAADDDDDDDAAGTDDAEAGIDDAEAGTDDAEAGTDDDADTDDGSY